MSGEFSKWLQAFRRQLPGVHVPELLAGSLVGGLGGAAYHKWDARDKDTQSSKRRRELDRYKLRSRVLLGALGGAGIFNLVGDRGRRWLSNAPTMAGYEPDKVLRGLTRDGFKGMLRGAIQDRPMPMKPDDHFFKDPEGRWGTAPLMRRELLRRALGVHSTTGEDWFQDAGRIQGADGRSYPKIELNKRFYDNPAGLLTKNPGPIFNALWGDGGGYGVTDNTSNEALRMSDVFAGFPTEDYGNVKRVTDYWDFDLSPVESAVGIDLAQRALKNPNILNRKLNPQMSEQLARTSTGMTAGSALASLALRKVFNNVFARHAPVFDQMMVVPPQGSGGGVRMLSSVRSATQGGPDRDRLIAEISRYLPSGSNLSTAGVNELARTKELADIKRFTNSIFN